MPWLVGVLILIGIVALYRWLRGASAQNTPLAILQQRYARGEIGREEYEQKLKDLTDRGFR